MEYPGSPYAQHMNNYQASGIKIKRLVVIPARSFGYTDMVIRPYTSRIDVAASQKVLEDIATSGSLNVFSNSTNNLVGVSARPNSLASIAGGWSAPRNSFRLEVECDVNSMYLGSNRREKLIVTGYTEPGQFCIPTSGGGMHVNTSMLFYINGIQKVEMSGEANIVTKVTNVGVSSDTGYSDAYDISNETTIKPVDIVSDINSDNMCTDMGFDRVQRMTTPLGKTVNVFERKDNIGKNYLNNIINTVVKGVGSAVGYSQSLNNIFGDGAEAGMSAAITMLSEPTNIVRNSFLDALTNLNGSVSGYTFTVNHLKLIDPAFHEDANITYVNVNDNSRVELDKMLNTADTETLTSASMLNAKVTELNNIISSTMCFNFLSHIDIQIQNQWLDNENGFGKSLQPTYRFFNTTTSLNNHADPARYNMMQNSLNHSIDTMVKMLIDPMLSDNGQSLYNVYISADITTDTTIILQINNGPMIPFRFPTFADTTFTPMIGTQSDRQSMVANIGAVVNDVADATSGSSANLVNNYYQ